MKYTPMSRRDTVAEWWESEPSHQRGMEIAADVKAKTGRYRPLMEPLRCRNCTASGKTARMIPALYAGPDGSVWLWTAGYRGLVNHPEEKGSPAITVGDFTCGREGSVLSVRR